MKFADVAKRMGGVLPGGVEVKDGEAHCGDPSGADAIRLSAFQTEGVISLAMYVKEGSPREIVQKALASFGKVFEMEGIFVKYLTSEVPAKNGWLGYYSWYGIAD